MVENLKDSSQLRIHMTSPERVFVPSVTEDNGNTIGLGVFSSEETAWRVLREFLKKSDMMALTRSDILIWEVDIIGDEAMTVLSSMHCRDCPVCKRRTFWVDLNSFSALCSGKACQAWIEESTFEPGKLDIGFPPTRFLKQTDSIEDAMSELHDVGTNLEAAGNTPNQGFTSIPEE